MKDAFRERYEALTHLTNRNTKALSNYLNQDPKKRPWGFKPDGSEVTRIDYSIALRSFTYISRHFPDDSINSEELAMLRPKAKWEFGEDPVDVTTDARRYDKLKPTVHQWASYMAGFTYIGKPVMFGLGVPTRNETYYGNIEDGIFLNGKSFIPEDKKSPVIIGSNENDYTEYHETLTSHPHAYFASICAWLALHQHVGGGIHPTERTYEIHCILAIARINGAEITDEKGNVYRSDTKPKYAVWSFPHIDHASLLKKIKHYLSLY